MANKTLTGEIFYPSEEVLDSARVRDWEIIRSEAAQDLQGFWAKEAAELHWFAPWVKVLDDSKKPFYQWFTG
ncbi:MAG: acetyl-coenzyme A synthetase N-terminal domain-containing protein, partial [Bacteroidota bacterium]